MKLADRDMNKQIDRKEFTEIMLPQLKAEVINKDQNLDDLRRLFKEFDLDQSNYLSKVEFREALVRLGVVLSDV
jgi:Ca2+-binding EF-hand superfamily protein